MTALVYALVCIGITAVGVRATFRKLDLDPYQTLVWFGLAEIPAPQLAPATRRALRSVPQPPR